MLCALKFPCNNRKFPALRRKRRARHIGIIIFDGKTAGGKLPLHIFRTEILQPIIDCARTLSLNDRVLIEDHFFLLILEGIQKTVIFIGRPEAIEKIGLIQSLDRKSVV